MSKAEHKQSDAAGSTNTNTTTTNGADPSKSETNKIIGVTNNNDKDKKEIEVNEFPVQDIVDSIAKQLGGVRFKNFQEACKMSVKNPANIDYQAFVFGTFDHWQWIEIKYEVANRTEEITSKTENSM